MPSAAVEVTTLSRELSDFFVEFSVGAHKHAIYPDGHPLLAATVRALSRRVTALLVERATLAFGVARTQLVVDGVATDPANPMFRDLALRLYRREIGAVKFVRGVGEQEISEMLRVVGRETQKEHVRPDARSIDTSSPEPLGAWPHLQLFPLSYEQLSLAGDAAEESGSVSITWAMQLWLGLARAAVAQEAGSAAAANADPITIANAIESRARDATYNRAIAAHLAQLAEEMRTRGGSEESALRKRVAQLVGALSPGTLRRLLEAGGSRAEQRKFMLDASHTMAADTVLDLANAAAFTSQQSISQGLLRVLSKLAKHAEEGSDGARAMADWALRENVRQLITDWDDDTGAAAGVDHWAALGALARKSAASSSAPSAHPCEPGRIVQMSLELGVLGVTLRRAVGTLVEQRKVGALLDLVDRSQEVSEVVVILREHLDTPETVAQLLANEPVDYEVLYRLVNRIGLAAADPLLDALQETQDRTTRWKSFELLAQFGMDIGPAIVQRFPSAPWYMQRNLLSLIGRLPAWPEGFTPASCALHDDERVRREAMKLRLADSTTRDQAICDGLADSDERIARMALGAAIERCPTAALPILLHRVEATDDDPTLRLLAVRALGASRSPTARDCLLGICVAGKVPLLRWRRLAPKSALVLAALQALAASFHDDREVAAVLALAAASSDAEVRAAAATSAVRV